jgi:D-xylose 1-dehydrogenase (NADP+, D-xylono-1,5-lactone-forming)
VTGTTIGFGVIGARSMVATRAVMPAIENAAGVHLAAVSALGGPVPERWAHLGAGLYDDVIDHPDVDAVYIPLPNGMHLDWVERAIDAGKHVLCEKPLAPNPADARRMAERADRAGVLLVEAWMTPFDARWRAALDLVIAGEIGTPLDIDASFTFTIGPEAADNYRWSIEQGGGALLDVGIYCLGPIVELWGAEPDLVEATALWHTTGIDARTEATLEWIDGRQARIRCSFVDAEEQRLEIIGDQASLVLDTDAHTGGASTIVLARRDGTVQRTMVTPNDPYRAMVEAFGAAVRDDEPWPRPVSSTVELLALVERIAESSR